MRTRKSKNMSTPLFKIDGFLLTNTLHIIFDHTKNNDVMYVISHFTYKNNRIHTTKKINVATTKGYTIDKSKEDIFNENKVKEEMKKGHNITIKELSKLTGLSLYKIRNNLYMKIRREQYPKVLR